MSRKQQFLDKRLILVAALALAGSGSAFADDSSMSRWTGDSYAYFNNLDYAAGHFNMARAQPAGERKIASQAGERALASDAGATEVRGQFGAAKQPAARM